MLNTHVHCIALNYTEYHKGHPKQLVTSCSSPPILCNFYIVTQRVPYLTTNLMSSLLCVGKQILCIDWFFI